MSDLSLEYRLELKDFFKKTMIDAVNETAKMDKKMKDVNSEMGKLEKGARVVGGAIAGFFAISKIKDFGSAVVDSLKNYEYFSASLRTLMYGDKNAAKALEGQLVSLAARTPFSLVDVQQGAKQLLAYGFSAGKLTKDMEMLGDVSSGVGAPLTDIIYLYGTLKTQGRAYTRDIMQFTSRGIPIIGQLAKQFHVSESAIKDMVEAGKIGFPEIEKAFKTMTSEGGQFFGMMEQQSQTVGGRLSNLSDSWEQMKVNIGKSQSGIIASTVSFAQNITSSLSKYFADSNQMDTSLKKGGSSGFTGWEKFIHEAIGVVTGYHYGSSKIVPIETLQQNTNTLVNSAANDPHKIHNALNYIGSQRKGILAQGQEENKLIYEGKLKYADATFREQNMKLAILDDATNKLKGSLTLLKTSGILPDKNGGVTPKTKDEKLTEVYGARAQNVTINLDRLGDTIFKDVSVTGNEGGVEDLVSQIRETWTKQMMEVLNDANLIAAR